MVNLPALGRILPVASIINFVAVWIPAVLAGVLASDSRGSFPHSALLARDCHLNVSFSAPLAFRLSWSLHREISGEEENRSR